MTVTAWAAGTEPIAAPRVSRERNLYEGGGVQL